MSSKILNSAVVVKVVGDGYVEHENIWQPHPEMKYIVVPQILKITGVIKDTAIERYDWIEEEVNGRTKRHMIAIHLDIYWVSVCLGVEGSTQWSKFVFTSREHAQMIRDTLLRAVEKFWRQERGAYNKPLINKEDEDG